MNAQGQRTMLRHSGTAGSMVNAAIAVATGRAKLASTSETLTMLRAGHPSLAHAFLHELARQVAAALLMLDTGVFEVYRENALLHGDPVTNQLKQPIRLWVVSRQRTPFLYACIDELNAALAEAYSAVCSNPPAPLLQTFVVDSRDGYLLRGSDFWHGQEPTLLASRMAERQMSMENGASQ